MSNPFALIAKHAPSLVVETIFDVGANKGDTVLATRSTFPTATIHAFEPVPVVFSQLQTNTADKNIHVHNLAVGRQPGVAKMSLSADPTMHKVRAVDQPGLIEVPMTTIDEFCTQQHIPKIDFMKVDTEGFDLEVLLGAKYMLQNISFIQCEVSANPHNKFHVDFRSLYSYLVDYNGFYLFQILDQIVEWGNGGKPVLRRFDTVFTNSKLTGDMTGFIS